MFLQSLIICAPYNTYFNLRERRSVWRLIRIIVKWTNFVVIWIDFAKNMHKYLIQTDRQTICKNWKIGIDCIGRKRMIEFRNVIITICNSKRGILHYAPGDVIFNEKFCNVSDSDFNTHWRICNEWYDHPCQKGNLRRQGGSIILLLLSRQVSKQNVLSTDLRSNSRGWVLMNSEVTSFLPFDLS